MDPSPHRIESLAEIRAQIKTDEDRLRQILIDIQHTVETDPVALPWHLVDDLDELFRLAEKMDLM